MFHIFKVQNLKILLGKGKYTFFFYAIDNYNKLSIDNKKKKSNINKNKK